MEEKEDLIFEAMIEVLQNLLFLAKESPECFGVIMKLLQNYMLPQVEEKIKLLQKLWSAAEDPRRVEFFIESIEIAERGDEEAKRNFLKRFNGVSDEEMEIVKAFLELDPKFLSTLRKLLEYMFEVKVKKGIKRLTEE